jgi:two-component system, NtrC family, sensor kinase
VRIRTHIISWILLATIIPLTAVALAAIYFLEREYRANVRNEISTSLDTITNDLKRHLESQRQLAAGLATANVVREYLAALDLTHAERIDSRYNIAWGRVNHYFEGFQTIVQGAYRMRLLDTQGNTLVKVSNNRRSAPLYASFTGMYYVEAELNDPVFAKQLARLPKDEVSNVILPHNQQQAEEMVLLPLYDYLVPVRLQQRLVGALALTLFGDNLDRVMHYAPHLYNAQLFIVEINPDQAVRNGLVLYDDGHDIQLSQPRDKPAYAAQLYGAQDFKRLSAGPYGVYNDKAHDQTVFHLEMFPYENQFVNWVVGVRIPSHYIEQPFAHARWTVMLMGGVAVFINLMVAMFGIQRFTGPLHTLSQNLLTFARGEHSERARTDSHVNEIRDLELAFNTMADSVDQAAAERDKAQHMLLQNAKLASIGQLAAGIGHELNNPLNNILSYAKLVERDLPQDATALRADLHSLKAEAQRASQIVQGILNFARQVPPHFAPFAVLPWLQDTLALVTQSAKTAGITLAYECVTDFDIEGDRSQLQQVLINLVLNAIAASARNDQVLVRAEAQASEIRISVIDQGTGIRPEVMDKIFDPFFTTKPEGSGSGLGLSISHGIVERHGGELVIYNNLDRGITAVIRLPPQDSHASSN